MFCFYRWGRIAVVQIKICIQLARERLQYLRLAGKPTGTGPREQGEIRSNARTPIYVHMYIYIVMI